MKASAAINIAVLDYVGEHIHAGMSTEEIDKMVYERTTAMGGIRHHCTIRVFQRAYVRPLMNRSATAFRPKRIF